MDDIDLNKIRITAFEEIADYRAKILILGTMPSSASIDAKEYYGHQDNLFWDIIFRVCIPTWEMDKLVSSDYEQKKKLLIDNQIALWDVLKFCDRKGSLDKDIRNQIHNDFKSFFQKYTNIKTIFFSSKKAEQYFDEYRKNESVFFDGLTFFTLQSTSPSNRTNSFSILKDWMKIREYINP